MPGEKIDRRDFLTSGAALVASGRVLAGAPPKRQGAKRGASMVGGFSTIIPRSKVPMSPSCASVVALNDGRIMYVWEAGRLTKTPRTVQAIYSPDGGRTWSDSTPLKLKNGSNLPGYFVVSVARLKSGRLGITQVQDATGFNKPSGATYTTTFHISDNDGNTWSDGVQIPAAMREGPYFDQLNVLSSGRLVLPFNKATGPKPKSADKSDTSVLYGMKFDNAHASFVNQSVTAYYSDDEGKTWKRSFNEVFASTGLMGVWSIWENGFAELADGRLMMLGHSALGRVWRAYSEDHAETWLEGEPTDLQVAGPLSVKRIPGTNDVLLIWVQMSNWEAMSGYYRHRLSCAVTSDGGKTFHNFKNLESLDDLARIDPEPLTPWVQGTPYRQPIDTKRYVHAPGPLRCDHPFCYFHEGNAIIGYGMGVRGEPDVITRFYGESLEHFNKRFGFEAIQGKAYSVLGSNKIRVVPIRDLLS